MTASGFSLLVPPKAADGNGGKSDGSGGATANGYSHSTASSALGALGARSEQDEEDTIVVVLIKAKNGYYQEENCPPAWSSFNTNVGFAPCPRPESCLGAPSNDDALWIPRDASLFGDDPLYSGFTHGDYTNNNEKNTANGVGGGVDVGSMGAGDGLLYSAPPRCEGQFSSSLVLSDGKKGSLCDELRQNQTTRDFPYQCATGYEGALCLACTAGYAKSSSDTAPCKPCMEARTTVMLAVFSGIIATVALLVLIRWALGDKGVKKNVVFELLKICYNHFQLLSIMAAFPVTWPSQMYEFYATMESISAGGAEILAPDCLLNGSPVAKTAGSKVYIRGLLAGIVPILSVLVIKLFWGFRQVKMCHRCWAVRGRERTKCGKFCGGYAMSVSAKEARQNSRIGIVMIAFVMHLMLVKAGLDLFVCKPIMTAAASRCGVRPPVTYLEADPTERCGSDSHTLWTWILGVPMLLFYGVGIPFGAFMILYWRRHKLQEDRCVLIYGEWCVCVRVCASVHVGGKTSSFISLPPLRYKYCMPPLKFGLVHFLLPFLPTLSTLSLSMTCLTLYVDLYTAPTSPHFSPQVSCTVTSSRSTTSGTRPFTSAKPPSPRRPLSSELWGCTYSASPG
jgi:hypothetical protein